MVWQALVQSCRRMRAIPAPHTLSHTLAHTLPHPRHLGYLMRYRMPHQLARTLPHALVLVQRCRLLEAHHILVMRKKKIVEGQDEAS